MNSKLFLKLEKTPVKRNASNFTKTFNLFWKPTSENTLKTCINLSSIEVSSELKTRRTRRLLALLVWFKLGKTNQR